MTLRPLCDTVPEKENLHFCRCNKRWVRSHPSGVVDNRSVLRPIGITHRRLRSCLSRLFCRLPVRRHCRFCPKSRTTNAGRVAHLRGGEGGGAWTRRARQAPNAQGHPQHPPPHKPRAFLELFGLYRNGDTKGYTERENVTRNQERSFLGGLPASRCLPLGGSLLPS